MFNVDVSRYNAWILALFFFSQGIFIYISASGENHLRLITIICLCIFSFLLNGIKFSQRIMMFFIVYLGIILLKFLIDPAGLGDSVTISAIRYLVEGCLICYLGAQDFSLEGLFRALRVLAIIVCIEACLIISNENLFLTYNLQQGWYMGFGYTLMPAVNVLFYGIFTRGIRERLIDVLIYVPAVILMCIYGNRGATLGHVILIITLIILWLSKKSLSCKLSIFVAVMSIPSVVYYYLDEIFYNLFIFFEGATPYSISKYMLLFYDGEESFSSSRDDIYMYVLDAVTEHPFLGNYIGYIHWKTSYAHNVFLEVMGNYGIPIFVIFLIFLLYVFYDVLNNSTYFNKQCFLVIASCFIARGMLSEGHFFDNYLMLIFGMYLSGKFTREL
ncbi:O-antigen ligase family protein [Anaerovibrio sp.]|uniref:O-antigen ligase family protein n=1 Tax=Anaerovibrio sp. TaxID=1872532 RepID=UPI00262F3EE8|nr:O-antigen ligase family protein [Anaerovibrio sp.]MDD6597325.1 O-antigen ligase family protein [Anaerovibrio sp.]